MLWHVPHSVFLSLYIFFVFWRTIHVLVLLIKTLSIVGTQQAWFNVSLDVLLVFATMNNIDSNTLMLTKCF